MEGFGGLVGKGVMTLVVSNCNSVSNGYAGFDSFHLIHSTYGVFGIVTCSNHDGLLSLSSHDVLALQIWAYSKLA